MRVISAPQEFTVPDLYVDLRRFVGRDLFVKCEGFNFAGSIKLKAALEIVERAERDGQLLPGRTIVESSSGNIGVALAMVAASRGYRFICVTDDHCTLSARQLMQNYGAEVHVLTEPHPVDGLVGARQRMVESLCAEHEDYVWLDQHTNPGNWTAHYRSTGPEILRMFPGLDVLFVGTGTAGTLMGCARYLREARRSIRVVAVDSVGSVSFGGPPGPRQIPGLGSAIRPALLDESLVDDVVHVEETETVEMCRTLVRHGFLFGGSTGTVVAGALSWLAREDRDLTAVAISPDLGDHYLDTVYRDHWAADALGRAPEQTTDRLSEVPR
ncbi:2,3-diaminopropionate biosynthesis protein SbnA [Amycolatopsis circi]|uniref:2,3-diaminopropionate biosynthesis protein SbnA n=1 Tax=Amycolatopsis circi TaxID=871959 RepID=UPI000E254259|nr:2,3-diaminopropionate biosynthesis protein SbnA [Amycolatopsis circi]